MFGPKHVDTAEDAKTWRRMLWLRHGCPISALYGDDGEMQCNKCMIDFGNESPEAIERRFHQLGVKELERLQAEGKLDGILSPPR